VNNNKTLYKLLVELLIQNNYYCILIIFEQNKEWTRIETGAGHLRVEIKTRIDAREILGRVRVAPIG
jgi:hypothetical protein